MSALFGAFRRDAAPVGRAVALAMDRSLAHRGAAGSAHWADPAVMLGFRGAAAHRPNAAPRGPVLHAPTGVALVADARIDNRNELRRLLDGVDAVRMSDGELILHAYLRWGGDCVRRLVGDFAFAVWDPRDRTLFCARDPMGVKPFYYFASPDSFLFATEAKGLHALSEAPDELDEEQVAIFLAWSQPDRDSTLFRGIRRLPAGHSLRVTAGNRLEPTSYWQLDAIPTLTCRRAEDYAEGLREIFTEAVRCRLRSPGPIATALSGGLDSSSITCTARRLLALSPNPPLHALSLVFPGLPAEDLRAIDERPFIDSVVAGGGFSWHPIHADELSPLGHAEQVMWHLDGPFSAPNLYLHWSLYGAASAAGATVFLDGLDGDSAVSHGLGRLNTLLREERWESFEQEVRLFAAHRQMGPESVLPHFGLPYLGELARRRRWGAWLRTASSLSGRFALSRREMFLRYGVTAAMRGIAGMRPRSREAEPLRRELARFVADREREALAAGLPTEREAHLAGICQPAYQQTLEIADASAAAFGVEPRYPFFDRRLIEFCVAVPEEQKFAGGWNRLLLRRAMDGVIPRDVQWRSSKANLSPNFARGFRAADRTMVESVDLSPLEPYADVNALRDLRRRYFADPSRGWGDPDAYLLFRATTFALWRAMQGGEGRVARESVAAA